MTEEEKASIRASFAGKRVSEMTEIERKVFDEDFQYGFGVQTTQRHDPHDPSRGKRKSLFSSTLLRKIGLLRK